MNDFKSDSKNPAQQEAKTNGSEVQASTSTLDKGSQQVAQPHKTDGIPSEKADKDAATDEASQAAARKQPDGDARKTGETAPGLSAKSNP